MIKPMSVLALPALLITGCDLTLGGESANSLEIGAGFSRTEIAWEGTSTVTRLAYAVRDAGGVTEICGAIATVGDDAAIAALETQILSTTPLVSGETVVAPDLAFFARQSDVAEGTGATCAMTSVPWNDDWVNAPPEAQVQAGALAG